MLMLEQVISRESIWEVVKAKEAFEAYATRRLFGDAGRAARGESGRCPSSRMTDRKSYEE